MHYFSHSKPTRRMFFLGYDFFHPTMHYFCVVLLALLHLARSNPMPEVSSPLLDSNSNAVEAQSDLISSDESSYPGCSADALFDSSQTSFIEATPSSDDDINVLQKRGGAYCQSRAKYDFGGPKQSPTLNRSPSSQSSPRTGNHHNRCPKSERPHLLTCAGPETWLTNGEAVFQVVNCFFGKFCSSKIPAQIIILQNRTGSKTSILSLPPILPGVSSHKLAEYCCNDFINEVRT